MSETESTMKAFVLPYSGAMVRIIGLAAIPWIIVYAGIFIYWPLWYYLAPIFLPMFCYQKAPSGDWSIFVQQPWELIIPILYTLFCATTAAFPSKSRGFLTHIKFMTMTIFLGAIVVHVILRSLFGLNYYMDKP